MENDIIKTIEEYYLLSCSSIIDKEEFIQECCVAILENPNISKMDIMKKIKKQMKMNVSNDMFRKAPHLYNSSGQCIDDNVYFISPSDIENSGRRIDDELLAQGKKLFETFTLTMDLINKCYKKRYKNISDVSQFRYFLRRKNPKNKCIQYISRTKGCYNGQIRRFK